MKNKRGSHIGMMLSFSIFVVFLVFLYIVLEPAIRIEQDKQPILESLKFELVKEFSANMTISTIKIDKDIDKECIKLTNLNILDIFDGQNLRVRDESGNILNNSKIGANSLKIDIINNLDKFFKIHSSLDIPESPASGTGCKNLNKDNDYEIGFTKTNKYIFETKIIDSINNYNTDYETLKNNLKVPAGTEFSFSFTYVNETTIAVSKTASAASIYSEQIPLIYINKDANKNLGILNIKIW